MWSFTLLAPDNLFLTYTHSEAETDLLFLPLRFPELEKPGFSKALRTAAFAYPFLFDNLPLFYRVRVPGLSSDSVLPTTLTSWWPSVSTRSLTLALCLPSWRRPLVPTWSIPSPTRS